ncbi:MAG: hypothetical protein AAGA75_24515 [Cyanobacteria bacterium P01_E01_bin.6]
MDTNQRMDYLYKEYVRLNEKVEEYIKGCFEDFKLLGAASASMLFWQPIAELITSDNSKINDRLLLFLGFLSLLLVFVLIGYRILIRLAFTLSMSSNLLSYEKEIREELNEAENSQVFNLNRERDTAKFSEAYRVTYGTTFVILSIGIIFIPFVILWSSKDLYAVIYLLVALLAFLTYTQTTRKLTRLFLSDFRLF